ncbi:hypothetical protein [Cupriavidus gilardii]|uniref:hypothetical protein n=1 Tax=Cupriavidus gilardii TaxID=82541 RepID=UPI0021BFFF1F|nr:hypothetical protein [Cupriavidus gilardii]MCT9123941.1 hypothetical protein [Cupriavidus gilardii]
MLHASTSRSPFNTLNPMDHARRASAFIARARLDSSPSDERRFGQFAIAPSDQPPDGVADACKSVNRQLLAKDDILKTLKARNISVHGAHIYHLSIPAIFLLSSAYASDRISRNVFFETLDLFVQHAQRDSDDPEGIKPHHLTRLGISASDARKLPLQNSRHDIVLVAGLLNGVIDMDDFSLLYEPGEKGRFLQRHFPGVPILQAAPPFAKHYSCDKQSLLVRTGNDVQKQLERDLPLICAELEYCPGLYSSTNHYKLRLLAAEKKGLSRNVIGPFDNEASMRQAFADTFHVVDPDYEPNGKTWRQDVKTFHFVEPKRIDWIPPQPKKSETGTHRSKPNRTCAELLCNVV